MSLDWNVEYDFAYQPKDMFSGIRFAIPLQDGRIVYMYEDFDSTDLNGFIILLDTQLFIKVWQNLPDTFQTKDFQHSNKSEWVSIENNPNITITNRCFSHGKDNPVPLAWVSCENFSDGFYWTNGITRTIWLLSNNAKYIPVFTRTKKTANLLSWFIGLKHCRNCYSMQEIISVANYLQ